MIRKENFLEILNPGVPSQLTLTGLSGQISKLTDKYSQSDVLSLSKNGKVLIPRTNRQHLNIQNQYLTFQVFIPYSKLFMCEISVIDSSRTKRKLVFSNCRGIQRDTLHCKIQNSMFPRDSWTNASIDLGAFTQFCFGYAFNEIDSISVSGFCKIRRIFSSKYLIDEINLPVSYTLPGKNTNILIEPSSIEDTLALLDNNRKAFDENLKVMDKSQKGNDGQTSQISYKSLAHLANSKSIGYTYRKNSLLKPLEKPGSLYQNVLNSLSSIKPSTPPFVHINQDPLCYDPISKSYIS